MPPGPAQQRSRPQTALGGRSGAAASGPRSRAPRRAKGRSGCQRRRGGPDLPCVLGRSPHPLRQPSRACRTPCGSHEGPRGRTRGQPPKKLNELPISRGRHTKKYWFGQDLGGKAEIIRLSIKTYPRGCSVPLDWVSDRGPERAWAVSRPCEPLKC